MAININQHQAATGLAWPTGEPASQEPPRRQRCARARNGSSRCGAARAHGLPGLDRWITAADELGHADGGVDAGTENHHLGPVVWNMF